MSNELLILIAIVVALIIIGIITEMAMPMFGYSQTQISKLIKHWENEGDLAKQNQDWDYWYFCQLEIHCLAVNGMPTGAEYPEYLRRQNIDT